MKTINLAVILFSISWMSHAQFLRNEKKLSPPDAGAFISQMDLNHPACKQPEAMSYDLKSLFKPQSLKKALQLEQQLDSVRLVYQGHVVEKNLYKYDSHGRCIEDVWFIHTNEGLIRYRKYGSTFDDLGNLVKETEYHWSDSINNWKLVYFSEYTYSLYMPSAKVTGDEDKTFAKTEYKYNSSANVMEQRHFTRDENQGENADWRYTSVDSIQYNDNYRTVNFSSYTVFPDFEPTLKVDYYYDERGKFNLRKSFYWNDGLHSWERSEEREFMYDEKGNITEASVYWWDNELQEFFGTLRFEFLYDDSNNMLTGKEYDFDRSTDRWIQTNLFSWEYSGAGNLLDSKQYKRNSENEEFTLAENYSFTYDETVPNNNIALAIDTDSPLIEIEDTYFGLSCSYNVLKCNHKLVKGYLINDEIPGDAAEFEFHYSPFVKTGIHTNDNPTFSLFPNPAAESITFNWPDDSGGAHLELYTINGLQVLNTIIDKLRPLSVGHLKQGVYFYRLRSQSGIISSGKLVIR